MKTLGNKNVIALREIKGENFPFRFRRVVNHFILLREKFLQFDWLRAVVFQLNLKYLHVKITNLLRVVVQTINGMICT